ncbi:unnamed protein product [Angiostrongylus costaricensis]|uniref:Fibronectin type-III domain-containing protein n=1 Tax=Angiostrongylus costaricensis TaxID=334426 RepID=A0A158PJW2_ANGCS|nr:unnamed protein product [Angiostrongylus costaricensis]
MTVLDRPVAFFTDIVHNGQDAGNLFGDVPNKMIWSCFKIVLVPHIVNLIRGTVWGNQNLCYIPLMYNILGKVEVPVSVHVRVSNVIVCFASLRHPNLQPDVLDDFTILLEFDLWWSYFVVFLIVYNPPKFMAGLMPKDKDNETFTHNQSTSKSRIHEPWTVEYFLNKPQNLDETDVDPKVESKKKKKRKKHHYEVTNKGIGKENCVLGSSALSENGNDVEHNTIDGLPTDNFQRGPPEINGAVAVSKGSGGYAISSTEKPTSPLAQEFVDVRSRHSLPLSCSLFDQTKRSTESYNHSFDGNVETSSGNPSNTVTSFAVSGAIKKQRNIKTRPNDVSLAKALGSSMAAELAYADKIEQTRKHLRATRQLKKTVSEAMERFEMDKTDDFDEILSSISLHDESLVTFDDEQAPNDLNPCSPVGLSMVTPGNANEQKVAVDFTSSSEIDKDRVGRAELKGEVDSYIRMRTRFYNLRLALLKLKKRLASTPTQMAKVKKLVAAANEDYESAIGQANSWLEYQVPQKELLKFIKIRQRKLCNETKDCGNTIRRLLGLESLSSRRDPKDAYLSTYVNTRLQSVCRNSAVRIDTEALNKSVDDPILTSSLVDCDMWNLSARSMRRNLEARREQAEILNKSFEEMSKDIEKRTKKSIAAQIVQYDRVIAERTDLITQLDKISSESNKEESLVPPEISTPRRVGVEPLDLDRLSPQTALSDEGRATKPTLVASPVAALEQPADQGNKSCSASSEGTLYEDSREKHMPSGFDKEFPSRRTLDTAEILTILSRHVVTLATDGSSRDGVKQGVENTVEDVVPQKMAHTNEEMRFDSEGAVAEAKEIIVNTNDVANTYADDTVLLNDVLLGSERNPDVIFTKPIGDEKDGSGDASYIQENIALDVSLAQFHLSEIQGRLDISERVGGSAVVVNPITGEEYTSANLSADHVPTSNPPSEISHSESLKGSFESDEDSLISSQDQLNRQNTTIILDKTDIVVENTGGIDQITDTATKYGENCGETTTLLSGFVSKEQILEEKIHDVEEFDSTGEEGTLVITAPKKWKSEENNFVHSFVIEALDARTDIDLSFDYLGSTIKNLQSTNDNQLPAVEKDDMLHVQDERNCNVAEQTAIVSGGNSKGFNLEEELKRIEFQEYSGLRNEEAQGYLTGSNDVVIGLNHLMETFTNLTEGTSEEKRDNDNLPNDVLIVENESKEVNTADENIEEKSEFNTFSFTRTELYDELSSSIRHLFETSSPRRSSLQLSRYRYELSESLLEDTKSSVPRSPPTPQERFMTKMPSSLSPRLGLFLEENLNMKVAETIAQEEAMRLLTDHVVTGIDEEIAQLELRRPLSKRDNKIVDSSEAQTELDDESYEDLLSIEKPSSIFDKLISTPPTNVTPEHEMVQRRKLENLREKVDSSDWIKEKCFQFSKEVWNLVNSRGFMRAMLDEFIPVPELECDTLALDEKERLIVRNKNTLIWATIVELAAVLWPESSAKRSQISSKWLPIPKSSREFAEMSERYVFEQLTGFQPSHRYMRLSRPWASDNSETMIDEAVACSLYGRDPNCVDFKRKVNAEYHYLIEELVKLAGDRFVSSAVQQVIREDESEVINTSPSSSFCRLNGEYGRPSLGGLSTNRLYDLQAPAPPHFLSE